MRRISCIFILFTLFAGNTFASSELEAIDLLIECTGKSLEDQKEVRKLLVEYMESEKKYQSSPEDNDLLLKFVRSSLHLLDAIRENHLEHTFDQKFMSELELFSRIARKTGVPNPS